MLIDKNPKGKKQWTINKYVTHSADTIMRGHMPKIVLGAQLTQGQLGGRARGKFKLYYILLSVHVVTFTASVCLLLPA